MIKSFLLISVFSLLNSCAMLSSKEATVGCQVSDAATTVVAIHSGAKEGNRLMSAVISRFGLGGFLAIKTAVTLALVYFHDDISPVTLATVNGVTCGAAVLNTRFIK